MKRIELIPESGKFYKVNMHSHTNISDGKLTPEEVKAVYKEMGYSAVCYTDHEVLIGHKDLCDDEFIALHGYEVSIKKELDKHTATFMPVYHFNMIAKDQDNLTMPCFFKENPSFPGNARAWAEKEGKYEEIIETTKYDPEWINTYLEKIKAGGFLINYNHPEWSLQSRADYIDLKHLHSIEVINGGTSAMNDNTAYHYHQFLRAGYKMTLTGGDDNHHKVECGKAWTMIKADELSYKALIDSYEKGYCYASEGPEILSIILEDAKVKVKSSLAARTTLLSEGRYTRVVNSGAETHTEAEFDYNPTQMGKFFRIEVRDAAGFRAFSSAYYIDEIEG